MRGRTIAACIGALNAITLCGAALAAVQTPPAPPVFADPFVPSRDHRAIQYSTRITTDAVRNLNEQLLSGKVQLKYESGSGYLRAVLDALNVPIESQMAVFSKTSLQATRIGPQNPRVIFFNDSVAVGWPRGGFMEVAAIDPEQGAIFYTMGLSPMSVPQFARNDNCLQCHVSSPTLGVPGFATGSVGPEPSDPAATAPTFISDHRSPFSERWGGWYVTGKRVPMPHMGTFTDSLSANLDTRAYPSADSDIVALMVLNHQTRMINLLTRMGWEVRVALDSEPAALDDLLREGAREVVDYMLFVDEAPFSGQVEGASGFAEIFSRAGPRDRQGRSLRDLDLRGRVMRYPCSYLIYSEQFDHLPVQARDAIYRRLWQVLAGNEQDPKYARLSPEDRTAIVEILRDTKKGLPDYFTPVEVAR